MSRSRILVASGALALAGLGVLVSPAGAVPTNCTGPSSTPRTGAVVVPTGATCTLTATDAVTDLTVNPGAHAYLSRARVDSVTAYGSVEMYSSTVRYSTVLSGINNGASLICSSTLGGAGLVLRGNTSDVSVAPGAWCPQSTSVSGNLKVMDNPGPVWLNAVSVGDFLLCRRSPSVAVGALTTLDGERVGC